MEPNTARRVYLWFDTEFTDLDIGQAHLLQAALVATDERLQRMTPAAEDLCFDIRLDPEAYVSPWVNDNLQDLLARCRSDEAKSVDEVDTLLADYVDAVAGPPDQPLSARPVLAGNSVYADLGVAKKWLPKFASRLHYRLLDVSTLKTLYEDWTGKLGFDKDQLQMLKTYFPGEACDFTGQPHDAYYDILASMAEFNFYREVLHPGSGT